MADAKRLLEKLAIIPAKALDKGLGESEKIKKELLTHASLRKADEFWHNLGPGLTTGAADDDPSGIATYSQAGAQYGFRLIWLSALTFPLMAVVQEMCARIGLVTGRGLAANIRHHYPRWVLYLTTTLLFAANTFNIGADLGAMAKSAQLLSPHLNFAVLVLGFTLLTLVLQIFVSYARYAKYLKYLSLVLLAYVFSALSLKLDWHDVLTHTFIPSIGWSKNEIFLICAVLGTTISPYLFFWQTSQEVEEQILHGLPTVKARQKEVNEPELKKMRTDVWSGMFFSNLVMFFIIAACAGALYQNGITNISTAAEAAAALRPFAGAGAYLLFTFGIIGIGLLAVPVLAGSASYAISESFGWREGLYRRLKQAYAFYGVIIIAMILGMLLNFIGLDPIKALIYSAVANGLVAPVVLILIVRLSSSKKVMGQFANHNVTSQLGWLITAIMLLVSIATIIGLLR